MSKRVQRIDRLLDSEQKLITVDCRLDKSRVSKTGIYIIRNKLTGDCYIGSTIFFTRRFADHRRDLKRRRHGCQHLQRAYEKYGIDAFEFIKIVILPDEVDKESIKMIEQIFLTLVQPVYNTVLISIRNSMSDEGKRRISVASQKRYILTDPEGKDHEVTNLLAFCNKHGLKHKGLYEVAAGRNYSSEGWKARYSGRENLPYVQKKYRKWKVTKPNGEQLCVENLAKFSRENGLPRGVLGQLRGHRVSGKYPGWKCEPMTIEERRSDGNNARKYRIIKESGETQEIINLAKYCRENNLSYHGMNTVLLGIQKTHQGLRCERIS